MDEELGLNLVVCKEAIKEVEEEVGKEVVKEVGLELEVGNEESKEVVKEVDKGDLDLNIDEEELDLENGSITTDSGK